MSELRSKVIKKAETIFSAFFAIRSRGEAVFLFCAAYFLLVLLFKPDVASMPKLMASFVIYFALISALYIFCFALIKVLQEFMFACDNLLNKRKAVIFSVLYLFVSGAIVTLMLLYFCEVASPYGSYSAEYLNIEFYDVFFWAIFAIFLILYPIARRNRFQPAPE